MRLVVLCALLLGAAGCVSGTADGPSRRVVTTPAPKATVLARQGGLTIAGGFIPEPASPDVAAAYLTIVNDGADADTLVRVRTDVTASVVAMGTATSGTSESMTELTRVPVPAHGSYVFRPGQAHLMLENPARALHEGDRVRMTLTFARAGAITVVLPVVPITGPS